MIIRDGTANIVRMTTLSDGKVVWLETGSEQAGLAHIVAGKEGSFAPWGISTNDIPDVVMQALERNLQVGTSNGAPVFLVGEMPVAVVVSPNGSIVTAYPVTDFTRF